ncbi:MAG: hypothetical protein R3A45_01880 [Bdellovibrionota bacterium]
MKQKHRDSFQEPARLKDEAFLQRFHFLNPLKKRQVDRFHIYGFGIGHKFLHITEVQDRTYRNQIFRLVIEQDDDSILALKRL